MPKFLCSYAHDLACFADFVVEATSERAALRLIRKALRDGQFANVNAQPCWENGSSNERVFVQGVADEPASAPTLAELVGEEHQFSLTTRRCVRRDRLADEDAVEHQPCKP